MNTTLPKYLLLLPGLFCAQVNLASADNITLAGITIAGDNPSQQAGTETKPDEPANATEVQSGTTESVSTETTNEQAEEPKTSGPKIIKSTPIKNTHNLRGLSQLSNNAVEKPKQYELHGIMNKQYVYMIVEKTGKNDITGYIFDGKGKKQYIYGEWVNNQLQVYDPSNKKFAVTLNGDAPVENPAPQQNASSSPFAKQNTISEINGQINISPDANLKHATIINNSKGSTSSTEPLNSNIQSGNIGIR